MLLCASNNVIVDDEGRMNLSSRSGDGNDESTLVFSDGFPQSAGNQSYQVGREKSCRPAMGIDQPEGPNGRWKKDYLVCLLSPSHVAACFPDNHHMLLGRSGKALGCETCKFHESFAGKQSKLAKVAG